MFIENKHCCVYRLQMYVVFWYKIYILNQPLLFLTGEIPENLVFIPEIYNNVVT